MLAALPAGNGPAAQPASDPPLPRLTGVVIGNGVRRAIFAEPDGFFSVAEGDRFSAYVVVAITPGLVQLRSPLGLHTLRPAPTAGLQGSVAAPLPPPLTDAQRQAEADNNK